MIDNATRKSLNRLYTEALDDLHFYSPKWAPLVEGLGLPVYSNENSTAWVKYDNKDKQILFCINPEFMADLDSDTLAAVMLHEAHHVFRDDLEDMTDRTTYPNAGDLVKAQECTINDSIEKTHKMALPEFVMRGETLAGVDMSTMSVLEAYEIFNSDKEEEKSEENEEGEDSNESSNGSDSSAGSGQNSNNNDSNETDDTESDETSDDSDSGNENPDKNESEENPDDAPSNGGDDEEESDEDSNDNGSGSEDEDSDESDETDDTESDDSDDGGDKEESKGYEASNGACGGIVMDEDDMQGFADSVGDILQGVADAQGITVADVLDKINNTASSGYSPTGAAPDIEDALTAAEAKWRELLIEINPKVKSSGGRPKRKTKNNWTTYNRALGSVYPKVVLPKIEAEKAKIKEDDGDEAPTFVVALDLSGSIDRGLVKTLKAWIEQIPEDLIRPFPITWSDGVKPYTAENRFTLVGAGGTNIHAVSDYVAKIERQTGSKPYVLVITDGEFNSNFDRTPAKEWIWMGLDQYCVQTLKSGGGGWYNTGKVAKADDKVYNMKDFM